MSNSQLAKQKNDMPNEETRVIWHRIILTKKMDIENLRVNRYDKSRMFFTNISFLYLVYMIIHVCVKK